ncbi:hypothetical protein [Pseudomonas sp. FEN]|uniref:hypothetical protein n=1 Tax=Pseudomonas sp. FEN TaxID=2767468 RepID=UPI00174E6EB0|nr:hypothetical protein [Pseudomonas sp. FEN]
MLAEFDPKLFGALEGPFAAVRRSDKLRSHSLESYLNVAYGREPVGAELAREAFGARKAPPFVGTVISDSSDEAWLGIRLEAPGKGISWFFRSTLGEQLNMTSKGGAEMSNLNDPVRFYDERTEILVPDQLKAQYQIAGIVAVHGTLIEINGNTYVVQFKIYHHTDREYGVFVTNLHGKNNEYAQQLKKIKNTLQNSHALPLIPENAPNTEMPGIGDATAHVTFQFRWSTCPRFLNIGDHAVFIVHHPLRELEILELEYLDFKENDFNLRFYVKELTK